MTVVTVRSIGGTAGDVVGKTGVTESSIWAVCGVASKSPDEISTLLSTCCRRSLLASTCVTKRWDADLGMGVWK